MSSPPGPLVPETYLDVPSQRLYYLSLGLLCQAVKLFDFIQYLFTSEDALTHYGRKWLFIDFAYCAVLARLRIPRLNYSKAVVLLHIASLWFLDGLLFGGISLNAPRRTSGISASSSAFINQPDLPSTPQPFHLTDVLSSLSFGLFGTPYSSRDAHLLGQHTVRMSPISTAQLNPNGHTFCLSPPGNVVLIPILLNNTNPVNLRYSLTPLGYSVDEKNGKVEYVDLSTKDLKAIERHRLDTLQSTRPEASAKMDKDDYDYEEDDADNVDKTQSHLQWTQSLAHIRLTKPGTVRLERVLDASNIDARLAYPSELTVVPCPRVEFVDDSVFKGDEDVRCAGQNSDMEFTIDIHGVPPLSLRWFKSVNGRREQFLVEGIDGGHGHTHSGSASEAVMTKGGRIQSLPQDLRVPLSVSLETLGSHMYALEEIMDGLGNTVIVGSESFSLTDLDSWKDTVTGVNSKISRSLTVLRRPTMSFKHCGPGNPTSMLIGSEAPLIISASEADASDAPWEVTLKYQPPSGDGGSKKLKPWKRTMTTQLNKRDLTIRASTPGEYTIIDVKGKYCEGDVLAPESCKVIERPKPTAEIEWKRIHECSGDTGVSASLVLHGTPPFQVYYHTQRDKEHPRELSKTFSTSRGELTLQPERSGHYIYTFVQMSDANYQKVELQGPSIDQVVHPLATAEFSDGQAGGFGRGKRVISSCSGNLVDVGVDLRGTGPWNIEIQITGPQSSQTLQISEITTPHKKLQVPIPKAIDRDGGSFDIDILNIEDSYGCKRSISGPGISVNVKRVMPTVKFYGKDDQRHVTVLEREPANLPLRLTGDGPWRIKYRRVEEEGKFLTKVLNTPNDQLHVTENGLYEILEVSDSQCPGSVIAEKSTYRVDWVPRPSVKLSSQTEAIYEPHNGSYILPPICEGMDDHVDLELTGRPPFQIMYNVAQDSDGGIRLLDQPTFNSIQPRTRFQLHTSAFGRKYYEVKQIGDAAYPLSKHKSPVIPRSERLLFEQEVSMLPSARFKNKNRMSYCLNDMLVPHDLLSADGLIVLEGTPPFRLQVSIKNLAASQVHTQTIELSQTTWKIDLPSYAFKSIGPHLITIDSVQDASHCAHAALDPLHRSIWVDVAETATILPIDRRQNYCVGDVSQFQLEGTPPWTIGYHINGKSYLQEAKVSPFSISQQQPGEFTITSISHQQKVCKAAVTDLRFEVHPLPSAQVGHGKRIFQDIHEGDQAEIVFTLIGEPPFTFTYQRAESSPRKGGKPSKVLETHTVSGVTANDYSIFSALEGTWTVTSISDRFCRYPPSQPDGTTKKQRH